MEYDLCRSNILSTKTATTKNFLYRYISANYTTEMAFLSGFMNTLPENLSDEHQEKISILLWKCLPGKAVLAQDFSNHILENLADAKTSFIIPAYIVAAFNHLKS